MATIPSMPPQADGTARVAAELGRLDLFRDVPARALAELGARCHLTRRTAGELVHDPAGAPPCVYAVLEGEVEVLRPPLAVLVGRVGPGRLLGEFTAIDGRRDPTMLRARVDTALVVIPRDAFLALLERHPGVALGLLRDLVGVVRGLNDRLAAVEGARAEIDSVHADILRFVI
jgi:CRP-like cAMP-binding protein